MIKTGLLTLNVYGLNTQNENLFSTFTWLLQFLKKVKPKMLFLFF